MEEPGLVCPSARNPQDSLIHYRFGVSGGATLCPCQRLVITVFLKSIYQR